MWRGRNNDQRQADADNSHAETNDGQHARKKNDDLRMFDAGKKKPPNEPLLAD
jgi:hypothetical protein